MSSIRSFVLVGVTLVPLWVACEPDPVARPGTSPQSSHLGISADGDTLYIALTDHDEVRAVDARTGEVTATVSIVGQPHRLTVLRDGRVAVTARLAGTVSVVDVEAGRVDGTVEVGSEPFAVVQVGDELVVAVAGEGDLARLSIDPLQLTSRVPLETDDPRGLAVIGGTVVVSHFTGGRLSKVDLDREAVVGTISMKLPSRPFFFPNQLDQLTVAENQIDVVAPHVECNNDPAQFGSGSQAFVGAPPEYYNDGPTGFPAVVPAVSRADVDAEVLISDDTSDTSAGIGPVVEPAGPVNPIINPLDRSLLEDRLVNAPTAVALADDGELELVVSLGSGNVVVRRSRLEEGQDSIVGTVDVGVGADSIVLSPDGATAFVWNGFEQTLTRFVVPVGPRSNTRFSEGKKVAFGGTRSPLATYEGTTFVIAAQALPDNVVLGRTLFHAVDQRLTRNGAIACASCHPGGGDDAITWTFAEGPRQSPPLWGGIIGTEPFHWDQAVTDIADISRATIIGRMGGTGLGRSNMEAIGAYLDTIPAPAPRVTVGVPTASIDRGAALFASAETACATCHTGADLTDGLAHNVGSGVGFVPRETMERFATPPLKGLRHSGPFMHDGGAATLRDVVDQYVMTDRMGKGSHLSPQDVDDLVAFLEAL